MSKLSTELFIARRIGGSDGSGSKGVMVNIAVVTTAVSLAVMIIAIGVIAGFRSEITNNITAFAGNLQVRALDYGSSVDSTPIEPDPELAVEIAALSGVRSIVPYALKTGIVKTDDATQGVVLKGIGPGYDFSFFEKNLVEGSLPRLRDSVGHKDILISSTVARLLHLAPDDRVEVLFVGGSAAPRRDRFRVSGLYSSGVEETDERFALTDISNVQRLNGWNENEVTGYEITIDDIEQSGAISARVADLVAARENKAGSDTANDARMTTRTIMDDYPQLFDWLATHDVNAAVIIAIMIVVAFVSMTSALLIILLERMRIIGILKTLGMSNGSLRRVFVLRSARIVLLGLLIGNVAGIGLGLLQKYEGIAKLNSEGYLLSTVPIELDGWWIAALNVGTLVVIVALMIFPTSLVGRITPEKTIRYQ